MTLQRAIIEMGTGNDQHGQDYTKAALRAVEDAIRHSSLSLLRNADIPLNSATLKISIGVQEPGRVDVDQLAGALPFGMPKVIVSHGGLDVDVPGAPTPIVVATAAVELFLPSQAAKWRAVEGSETEGA